MNLQQEIRNFVVENFLFGEEKGLTDDSSFIKEGIVDSTGIMQLVSFIQDHFGIAVEDEELVPENLDSINKVSAFVEGKKRAAASAAAAHQA